MSNGSQLRDGDDDGMRGESGRHFDVFDPLAENAILQPTREGVRVRLR